MGSDSVPLSTPATLTGQLDELTRYLSKHYELPLERIAVIAQGASALLAAAWIHDYAPHIRSLILTACSFAGEARQPSWSNAADSSPEWTTTAMRILADAQLILRPVQMLIADPEGEPWANVLFGRLGSPSKELHQVDDGQHPDPEQAGPEQGRSEPSSKARDFLLRSFAQPPQRPCLLQSHRSGPTKEEYDRLCRPLPLLSRQRLRYALGRVLLHTLGRMSTGIRIGLKEGFDSGSNMDYVYRCEASGFTSLGRAMDASYLDSVGWRSIRARRQNLEQIVLQWAAQLRADGQPVVVLDIAAGHGRYVMETVRRMEPQPERILLRDNSAVDVEQGRDLLVRYGLSDIAAFEQADGFDRSSLAAIRPRPTLSVVCGLYELFSDNTLVRTSLQGLADVMQPGSVLIYTGHPWHPELEILARLLPSDRPNQPSISRRRSQEELDQLVASAGFTKVAQRIDDQGIFTVSVARRNSEP